MNHTRLVQSLAAAFDGDAVVTAAPEDLPTDIETAEAIEDAVVETLGPIGAFKLGATIPSVRAGLGLARAFFGPIPSSRIFADGADVPAHAARQRGIECEFAFRFDRDLPASGAIDVDLLWSLIGAVHPAIEIPGTRFERLAMHGGLGLVADVGAVGALVLGPACPLPDLAAMTEAEVSFEVEGEPPVRGSGAPIEGGPTAPLLDFCAKARARGYAIRAGQVVCTGSCTGYVNIDRMKTIRARFALLDASVSMRFV